MPLALGSLPMTNLPLQLGMPTSTDVVAMTWNGLKLTANGGVPPPNNISDHNADDALSNVATAESGATGDDAENNF